MKLSTLIVRYLGGLEGLGAASPATWMKVAER